MSLSELVNRSFQEAVQEWKDDPVTALEMNRGIRYQARSYRPRNTERPFTTLRLHVTRQHPLTLALQAPHSLLVLFSPWPEPQKLTRRGIPHEITQLAACSSLAWQLFAKQLKVQDHTGRLEDQQYYYFPHVKVKRDHTRPGFPELYHPVEISVVILSDRESNHWERIQSCLVSMVETHRRVILGPFHATDKQYLYMWHKISEEFPNTFDEVTFCVSAIHTELALSFSKPESDLTSS